MEESSTITTRQTTAAEQIDRCWQCFDCDSGEQWDSVGLRTYSDITNSNPLVEFRPASLSKNELCSWNRHAGPNHTLRQRKMQTACRAPVAFPKPQLQQHTMLSLQELSENPPTPTSHLYPREWLTVLQYNRYTIRRLENHLPPVRPNDLQKVHEHYEKNQATARTQGQSLQDNHITETR